MMRTPIRIMWCLLPLVGVWSGLVAAPDERVGPGSEAPAVAGADGQAIDWSEHEGEAIVLVFHSGAAGRSLEALGELGRTLRADVGLAAASSLYVLVDESVRDAEVERAFEGAVETLCVLRPKDRRAHEAYGVIVYPSAFVLSADGRVIEAVRGSGPMFAFRVGTAARLAAGRIDKAEYDRLRGGHMSDGGDGLASREARTRHLIEQLVASGHDEQAIAALRKSLDGGGGSRSLEGALVRLLLASGDLDEAERRFEAWATHAPDAPETVALRARLAVARGRLDRAAELLAPLTSSSPAVRRARGALHEAREEWRDAAREYAAGLDAATLFD